MNGVKTYQSPQRASPVAAFLDGLEPKLREKLIRQIFQLPHTPLTELKEPHYMSHAPMTTVKDGRTLSLAGVDWQVIGTDLVGETLTPSSYQAVATYSGKASYSYATGYVSTAEYVGEVTRNEVESVTYTVLYTGEVISPAEPAASEDPGRLSGMVDTVKNYWPALPAGIGGVALAVFVVLYLRERRKNQDAEYVNAPFDSEETEGPMWWIFRRTPFPSETPPPPRSV